MEIALLLVLSLVSCVEPPPTSPPTPDPVAFEPRAPLEASMRWPKLAGVIDAPMTLTASDGTGLRLVAMNFRASIQDPLAFTEIHLEFDNPEPRTLEGRFEIVLPPGAAVSRFAMEIGGNWQEGEVVEIQAARRAYEDALHRKQDPALLEAAAGNRFQARVFPIPGNGRKRLILSYSHELDSSDTPYRLPLRGLPSLESLDGSLVVDHWEGEPQTLEVHQENFTPDADLEVQLTGTRRSVGLRSADLAVARIQPPVAGEPESVHDLTVLLDSSASRALGLREQLSRLTSLITQLSDDVKGDLTLRVACFDQELWPVYEGPASGYGPDEEARILQRGALGASDLGAALRALGQQERLAPRLLIVSDGIMTAGEVEAGPLQEALAALHGRGVLRVDALVDGGIRDESMLKALVTAGLDHDGVMLDAVTPVPEIARRLALATRSGIELTVPGARWLWPDHLDGVQPGDDVLVYAQLPANEPFVLHLDGVPADATMSWAPVERPLLERAVVRANIERLTARKHEATDPTLRAELQKEILDLSLSHRVLTPQTALLVLETDQDYARFGLDRDALTDLLTVGPRGIEVKNRGPAAGLQTLSGGCASYESASIEAPAPAPPTLADPEASAEPPASAPERDEMPAAQQQASAVPERSDAGTNAPPPPPPAQAAQVPQPAPEPAPRDLGARAEEGKVGKRSDAPRPTPRPPSSPRSSPDRPDEVEIDPYTGKLAEIMDALSSGDRKGALQLATRWRAEDPGDVLALVGLGETFEALDNRREAARAYGSIIDLFPARADLRRMAGERLERLEADGLPLAVDTYRKAVAQRPDHPHGHRLLAIALLRTGRLPEAFDVLEAALRQEIPAGRFAAWDTILREDLGLVAAAWMASADDTLREKIRARMGVIPIPTRPSLRFVLVWETDANDVDFHIFDGRGNHAFYRQPNLGSGGALYADVTTGYGPECFTIEGEPSAYPYTVQAHYYSRGPMGYGMGKLEVLQHDGRGGLVFEERPFIIMQDRAFVRLGQVRPL